MKRIPIIDSHTGGEPTRVVLGGVTAENLETYRRAHRLRATRPPPRASLQLAVFSSLTRPAPHSCTSAGKPELPLYTSAPTGLRNTAQGCRALARLPWVSGIRAWKQTQHIATHPTSTSSDCHQHRPTLAP
jgi:hypothetical protein